MGVMREMHAREARCRKNVDHTVFWVVLIESLACLLQKGGTKASERKVGLTFSEI